MNNQDAAYINHKGQVVSYPTNKEYIVYMTAFGVVCKENDGFVPVPDFRVFSNQEEAQAYADELAEEE